MQKFTRPLTREIELAGQRLALTFTESGLAVRPVGSRKPPREITWAALIHHLGALGESSATASSATEGAASLDQLKSSAATNPRNPAPATATAPPAPSGPGAASAGSPNIQAVLARLDRWLAEHRARYRKGLRPGASAAELDTFEAKLGRRVPPELRSWLGWHNGQSDEFAGALEESWNLMSTEQILAATRDLTAPPAEGEAPAHWQPGWVPFLDDDAGNYRVLDTTQSPAAVREYWAGKSEQPQIAASLAAWLEDFVSAAERGAYHEDPERGHLLRQ